MQGRIPTPTILALALGLGGAGIAALLSLPAGPLVGAALATGAGAALGMRLDLAVRLRDIGFCLIGITLGAGIRPDFADELWRWSPSLGLLMVAQVVTILSGARLLARRAGLDHESALLAASPGGLSTAISLALDGGNDATPVLVLQIMRILVLVTLTPPLALMLSSPVAPAPVPGLDWTALLALLAVAYPVGVFGARRGLPASTLLLSMILSGTVHGLDIVHGRPPAPAVFFGFALAGTALGTRLTGLRLGDLSHYAGATCLLLGNAMIVSLAFAAAASRIAGLDPGATWIAFAPGGVEAMAAIGLALGYDPAFIAIHHVSRILFLTLFVPILIAHRRKARVGGAD